MAARASKPVGSVLTIKASHIAKAHTILALSAFFTALCLGCIFHYKKIVKNGVAGYPEEWFPSVSATIGDWYPERNIFQIMIALTSGPRFALVFLQYHLSRSHSTRSLPFWVLIIGIVRTLSCGGWVYITSTDDHDAHDVLMITYILCNVPWMFGGIACTPETHAPAKRRRKFFTSIFFLSMIPLVYFFIQHKVYRIPGAYTRYSFFEWGLIITDVLYDSVTEIDFAMSNLEIKIGTQFTDSPSSHMYGSNVPSGQSSHETTKQIAASNMHKSVAASTVKEPSEKSFPDITPEVTVEPQTSKNNLLLPPRSFLSFMSDTYLAYVFWSNFTSLPLTLFYFSVWELGIAGHELALLSILSPIFLGVQPLRQAAQTKSGRVILHLLSLAGPASYKLDSPLQRLLAVSFATVFACIGAAVDLSAIDPNVAGYQGVLLGIGLILSSLSKHANHGNNPIWPILDERSGGYNKIGLILAIVSIYEYATRPQHEQSLPVEKSDDKVSQIKSKKSATKRTELPRPSFGSLMLSAAPLGSLVFALQYMLADPNTLIAWSWTGYPIQGPMPHTHGSLTLIAQTIGLLLPILLSLSTVKKSFLTRPSWYVFGSVSSYVLYHFKDWFGYAGGLGFTVFLMSVVPHAVLQASQTGRVASTYFITMLIVVLLDLASIWTVAYAFVPGGPYLRERTDLVLLAQIALLVPAFNWPVSSVKRTVPSLHMPSLTKAYACSLLACISVLSVLVTLYRTPTSTPQPYRPGPRILRAGIWTVHFGIDTEGRDSQRRMRDLIRDMELDVVGLLETDLHRVVFGNRDLTRVLTEEVGYYVDVGPGPNQHTWGAVLLSKFPIMNSTHHLLPSPRGELAPCIAAVLDVWGTKVHVFVAHNGQEEDPLDRELQSKEIARLMAAVYPEPVIFLGYLVTTPHAPRPAPYEIMVSDGRVHDIDAQDLDRWCEYIFYRGLYRTSYARVSRSTITDTELQIGQFTVPQYGDTVVDDSEEARYLRRRKEELPTPHWFPMEYYGSEERGGKNGHFYHVFGTPLYYQIPEGSSS